jgi:hypothetical protein
MMEAIQSADLISSGDILYGTADYGGLGFLGTIYAIGTNGTDFKALYGFAVSDGFGSLAGLILSGGSSVWNVIQWRPQFIRFGVRSFWRYLPADFPHWKTVYHVFRQWTLNHHWAALNDALRTRPGNSRQAQPAYRRHSGQSKRQVRRSRRQCGL